MTVAGTIGAANTGWARKGRFTLYALVFLVLPLVLPLFQGMRTVHAAPSLPASTVVSTTADLSVTGGTVDVMCKPGDFATGGGFEISPPGLNIIRQSEPDVASGTPRGWHVLFASNSGTAKAFVVCMTPATFGTVTTTTTVVEADRFFAGCSLTGGCPSFNAGGVTAVCSGSDFATGGGFETAGGKNVLRSRPDPASGQPNGWHSFFSVSLDTGGLTVKSFVVCMTPVNLGTSQSSSYVQVNSAPVGNTAGSVSVTCRPSDFATGGGFDLNPSGNKFTLHSEPDVASGTPMGWTNHYGIGGSITGTAYAVCIPVTVIPAWKAAFEAWKAAHCQVLTPQQVLNFAFIPVKFMGDTATPVPLAQIAERLDYIKDYYYQQSMCSVQVNPTILSNPSDTTAGRWTLPLSEAQYLALPVIGSVKWAHDAKIWSDAYSLANPTTSFDAIVTLQTSSAVSSNSMFNRGMISPGGAVLAAFISLFLGPLGITLDMLVAAAILTTPLFHQGSVMLFDNDEIETWAHELGHGLFSFWDYYEGTSPSNRGVVTPWDLMSNPKFTNPAPVGIYNRQQAGWLNYNDVKSFGTYPLTFLTNLKFGKSEALRYRSESCVLFICTPNGPVDEYILELRSTPDDVPTTPPSNDPATNVVTPSTGLVIYEQREVRNIAGIPTRTPYCGGLHGLPLLLAAAVVDHGISDCLNAIANVMLFPSQTAAQNNPTVPPGTCYIDDVINVTFCLNTDMTNPSVTIHGSATSRNVISMETDGSWTCAGCAPPNAHVKGYDLTAKLPRADLHVNGPSTEHVGPNYQTGAYDLSVPGSRVGGAYSAGQWISYPDSSQATFTIDGTRAFADAAAHGFTNVTLDATVFVANYDSTGARSVIAQPVVYHLDPGHPKIGPLSVDTLTMDGATTADFHDAATVSATLRNFAAQAPISGQSVKFTLNGAETCTGTTDVTGKASCQITPGEAAGTYTLTASFASSPTLGANTTSSQFMVTREETTLAYAGDTVIGDGLAAQLSAVLKEDGTVPLPGRAVTLTLGSGATAQSCNPATDATGTARCTISPVNQPLGPTTVSASFAGDGFYKPAADSKPAIIIGPPAKLVLTPATATNVVGTSHTVTATVTDAFGSPVLPGNTVTFAVTGANTAGGTVATNASGVATFTYSGTHFGADVITASASATAKDTAAKNWKLAALDNFKCYSVKATGVDEDRDGRGGSRIVTLTDQFGAAQVIVEEPRILCDPAGYNGSTIITPSALLNGYQIEGRREFRERSVEVTNKFGTESLQVDERAILAEPASKAPAGQTPGPVPITLNNFQCYSVEGEALRPAPTVTLNDQFGTGAVRVGRPVLLCNPTEKNNEKIGPVVSGPEHLVCYSITSRNKTNKVVEVRDQFGVQTLKVVRTELLCVPSDKKEIPTDNQEGETSMILDENHERGHRDYE